MGCNRGKPASRRVLAAVLLAGVACGPPPAVDADALASSRSELMTTQGFSHQGFSHQGFSHQGTSLVAAEDLQGFSLSSLVLATEQQPLPGAPVVGTAQLKEGQLWALRSQSTGRTASQDFCPAAPLGYGLARACGWSAAGVGACTVGQTVHVATSQCGGCLGDMMLRVCTGAAPCEQLSRLAENDDTWTSTCQSLCPSADFVCPASGTFNVLTAPFASNEIGRVSLVASGPGTPPVFPRYNVVKSGTALAGAALTAHLEDGGQVSFGIGKVYRELRDMDPAYPGTGGYTGTTLRYQLWGPLPDGGMADVCGADAEDYPELYGASVPDGGKGQSLPVALAVSGWWDRSGAVHREDPDRFTFSCRAGVVSKCYRWGYRPWLSGWVNKTYVTPGVLEKAHQTCTRMARADYCGNGLSYTVLGTMIDLWDDLAPQLQARASDEDEEKAGISFEAGWSPEGATCLNHVRWAFAPPEVLNPQSCRVLHDPKAKDAPLTCDTQAEAKAVGVHTGRPPLLFDASAFNAWDGGTPWYALDAGS